MSVSQSDRPSIEDLAEEFLERRRRGERPTLDDYASRYPDLAGEIREFFPVLGLVEDFKPDTLDATGSIAGSMIPGFGTRLDRLGDFRLLREVGRGGMGVVYEAEQESLGRRVALKVLRSHRLHDPKILIRFHREAKAAGRLHHTNIVPVFGMGEHEGVHFYVMQFIPGLSLDAVLDEVRRLRGPSGNGGGGSRIHAASLTTPGESTVADLAQSLATGRFSVTQPIGPARAPASATPSSSGDDRSGTLLGQSAFSSATDSSRVYARSVARVGLQVAEALDYAHQHGILHRDIKPSNLLLDAHGMIWVTDFGLAKIESDSDLTRTGDIVGTIRYLAPERFAGRCDARADVYALGLTLYELLARRPAFEAEDRHSLIRQVTQDEPRRLRQVDPTIPRDLETIVQTAIAKEPLDRYATAAALRDELERFLADRPIRSRPVSPLERYWRWCKRNPLLALASSVACALVIAIAIVSTVAAFRNGRLADQLKAQRDEANRNLIQAYTNEAEARRHSRRAGQRFEALDAIGRAMRLPGSAGLSEPERLQLRNQAIGAMGLPDMRVVWQVELADPIMGAFAVDASFERYALKRDDGTVVIRRLADHRELLALPDAPCANRSHPISEFSPDGRYLAVKFWTDRDVLHVWDLQSRRLILAETNFSGCLVATWAFHPDGRRLAFGRTDGSIVIFDLKGGLELSRWPSGFGSATSMAFNADGSQLAFVSAFSGSIHVLSTDSGRAVAQLDNPATVFHLAWNPRSPDCLAAGLEDNTIRIWDIGTRRQTATLEGDSYNGLVVAFHPDGALLVSRGWSGMIRFWDIRTRQQILSMPSHWLPELRFLRDGSRLSGHSASGHAGILEVSYETECRSLFRQPGPLSSDTTAMAIDRNGRLLANSCATGITVWDLPTGSPLALLPVSGEVKGVQFDPAGSILTSYPMTLRWPISSLPDGPVIGPPQLLQWYQTRDGFMNSRDGCVVAMANYDGGGLIFDADHPDRSRRILPHRDVRGIALSPDGRWLVTCSFGDGTLKLWDTRAGHVSPDIPAHLGVSGTVFSPDGRWLALCKADRGWELIETQTWTSRIRLGNREGPAAFSPDSAIFAHETYFKSYDGSIALVELATGRELARINDPDGANSYRIEFSPDGMQLIGVLSDQPYVRIWDLRSVRQRLAELDLDWSPPAAGASAAKSTKASGRPSPPTFRVDRGLLDHWIKLAPIKRREQAIADAEAFLRQEPDQKDVRNWLALCCNALAWELVARSNSDRDPLRALPLARRAVALEPDRDMFRKTLGMALYRSGRPAEAITVLERSLAAKDFASIPYDFFLLALCHAKQNEAAQARVYFNRALLWLKSNSKPLPPADEELSSLRAEAEVLLRSCHAELPEDVFAKVPAPG